MRPIILSATASVVALFALGQPALAETRPAAKSAPARPAPAVAPKRIGVFDDWTAATNVEAGQKVCYAFASALAPAAGRAPALLTVTQRQGGRDAVSISAGFEYAANATVAVQADGSAFEFYTAKRSAFARDGHAAVAAFLKSAKVTAKSPGPRNAEIIDGFSLKGFERAYAAINRECPGK